MGTGVTAISLATLATIARYNNVIFFNDPSDTDLMKTIDGSPRTILINLGQFLNIATGEIQGDALAADELTAAEIGAGAVGDSELVAPTDDALGPYRLARATYDFAVDGGAISAISLTTTLPDNAIVVGGFVDVITTCTSATDAGTGAISVEGADDIVAALAISNGANIWDAGQQPIVPKANTPETTAVKTTAARAITFTIAVENFTAGAFVVFLLYTVSD